MKPLIAVLVIAAALAAPVAASGREVSTGITRGPTLSPPADMTAAVFVEKRWNQWHRYAEFRRGDCREPSPFRHRSRDIKPWRRHENVAHWHDRGDRARARDSRCVNARLWAWYRGSGATCVHGREGAWSANTGNGYYGGFQADVSFQRTYNPKAYYGLGTANNWPIIEQVRMAYNGWLARGWYPWPNTARACGLI